jgi:hypothetical protein
MLMNFNQNKLQHNLFNYNIKNYACEVKNWYFVLYNSATKREPSAWGYNWATLFLEDIVAYLCHTRIVISKHAPAIMQ